MTKEVKIILAVVAVVFIGAVIATCMMFMDSDSEYVEVLQDNKVIMTIDISDERDNVWHIESSDGGWNEITLKDGKISVTDSDCPDKTCIKTGNLRSESVPIVCLPHKLVIRFSDKNGE